MGKISELVNCAMINIDTQCDDVKLSILPNSLTQSIASKTGVMLRGVNVVLTAFAIRHIIKQHGNELKEKERNQIGVTSSDFELIPDILKNPGTVLKGSIERGKQSVLFIKNIKCFYHVAMLIEGKKDGKKLVLRTMYKSKINKKADV